MPPFASATRRQLIGRAGAVAGLGALGTTVASALGAASAGAKRQAEIDAEALHSMVEVELLAIVVYERSLGSGLLSTGNQQLASKLLGHESAHARRLELELHRRGQTHPPRPASASEADRALAHLHVSQSLTSVHGEPVWIQLLLDLEASAEGVYYDAISKLGDPTLLRTAAEILASEAQHATLLARALYPGKLSKAVPDAFVQGKH